MSGEVRERLAGWPSDRTGRGCAERDDCDGSERGGGGGGIMGGG